MKRGDKRGLSGIVTSLILIVLVLVAAGIVWAVYNSLIKGSAEDTEFSAKCLGIFIKANLQSGCTATSCSVLLERDTGSSGEAVDGVEVTFSTAAKTSNPIPVDGNIGAKKLANNVPIPDGELDAAPTSVNTRIYFFIDATTKEKYFCAS